MARPSSPGKCGEERSHADVRPLRALPYRGRAMNRIRRLRRVLQGDAIAAAAADLRADRRPPRLAQRGPRHLRRRLAPVAEDLPPARPRELGPAARVGARAAPAHRADLAPRPAASTRRRRSTLEALGKLPVTQRKALLLDPPRQRQHERPGPRAQPAPRRGRAACCRPRPRSSPCTATSPPPTSGRCSSRCASRPRTPPGRARSILRRPGAARRRTHTLVGVARRRRRRARQRLPGHRRVRRTPDARPANPRPRRPSPSASPAPKPEPPEQFSEDVLLTAAQVSDHVPGRRWTGDEHQRQHRRERPGPPLPGVPLRRPEGCGGVGPRVRHHARKGGPQVSAVQETELSASPRAAHKAYRRHRRLVRRVLRAPRPAGLDPRGRRASATRRCSSSSRSGASPTRPTSPASRGPAGSPRRR